VNFNRRAFLQQLTLALGALGVGGTGWLAGSTRYQQALAKPARRKLALLIGINQYPDRVVDPVLGQDVVLKGCLTDLELQRQLLLYRFGFQSADILTLRNQEATRTAILDAIDQHLIAQAKADDTVILHFSGYGSRVNIEGDSSTVTNVWVPVDGRLPSEETPTISDVLEIEIVDRLQKLATPRVVTVIDAGSQDVGYLRWGNLKLRSRPTAPTGVLKPDLLLPQGSSQLNQPLAWPGLVLRAGEPGHLVLESQWEGFSAGVFTYALTQILWESLPDPSPKTLIRRSEASLQQWTGPDQEPVLAGRLASKSGFSVYLTPPQTPPADGVILPNTSSDRPLTLWLGGMPATVLQHLQPGTRFFTVPADSTHILPTNSDAIALKLESRNGIKATARLLQGQTTPSLARQPVYEKVRLIARDIDLVVALDAALERVERVDATSALASIPFVTSTTAGEQPADCLFGRLPTGLSETLTASLPSTRRPGAMAKASQPKSVENSYGLFAPNRTLIPGTLLAREEAVKTAVNRLTPHLQTLLAMKLVRLTQNRLSSWLAAAAVLETTQPKVIRLIGQQTERPGTQQPSGLLPGGPSTPKPTLDSVRLTTDNRIVYRVTNHSDQPLYFTLISFDSRGDCNAFILPPGLSSGATSSEPDVPHAAIAPGQTQLLPDDGSDWGVPSTATWVETHVVLSSLPLNRFVQVLNREGKENPLQSELKRISEPLTMARALLEDLSNAAARADEQLGGGDKYALHQEHWVTFSFRYSVL